MHAKFGDQTHKPSQNECVPGSSREHHPSKPRAAGQPEKTSDKNIPHAPQGLVVLSRGLLGEAKNIVYMIANTCFHPATALSPSQGHLIVLIRTPCPNSLTTWHQNIRVGQNFLQCIPKGCRNHWFMGGGGYGGATALSPAGHPVGGAWQEQSRPPCSPKSCPRCPAPIKFCAQKFPQVVGSPGGTTVHGPRAHPGL